MQVETLLSSKIQSQLTNTSMFDNPVGCYIEDLIGCPSSSVLPNVYENFSTIEHSLEVDCIEKKFTFTHGLQLLHLNYSIDPTTELHQSILNKIETYFLIDKVHDEQS
ncbi:hypothetical protein [Marinicellulosiphila megalodicopiae]|uniref:hypothetical protein n=1 Tax=Marinicellulosiphila megalodicopiae TaxID=2724896 RepID=UPI003BAF98C9